jgi:Chaperone of endosialidase
LLFSNTTGGNNTASGVDALYNNSTGASNTADGTYALDSNSSGSNNTASGFNALVNNTTGGNNIGLGYKAASNIVAGNNNIDIGNTGTSSDTNTVRIGIQSTQTRTFIAGVSGILSGGSEATELAVNRTTGQIGVIPSSARFKRDIHDMGGASTGLMRLRPVSFRYKDDPSGTLQYGLIAEEIARVYPELVVRGTDGKVESVRYLELTGLLLNELQKQVHQLQTKDAQLAAQQREIDAFSTRLAALEQQARTATPQRLGSQASK